MKRRSFLRAAAALPLLAASPLMAQTVAVTLDDVRRLFESRDAGARRMAQQGLKGEGFYSGPIDGAWGPGTEAAYRKLMASERYLRHAPHLTWPHEAQVIDTMVFLNSDAFL